MWVPTCVFTPSVCPCQRGEVRPVSPPALPLTSILWWTVVLWRCWGWAGPVLSCLPELCSSSAGVFTVRIRSVGSQDLPAALSLRSSWQEEQLRFTCRPFSPRKEFKQRPGQIELEDLWNYTIRNRQASLWTAGKVFRVFVLLIDVDNKRHGGAISFKSNILLSHLMDFIFSALPWASFLTLHTRPCSQYLLWLNPELLSEWIPTDPAARPLAAWLHPDSISLSETSVQH